MSSHLGRHSIDEEQGYKNDITLQVFCIVLGGELQECLGLRHTHSLVRVPHFPRYVPY